MIKDLSLVGSRVKTSRLLFGGLVGIIIIGASFLSVGSYASLFDTGQATISDLGFTPTGWMGDWQDIASDDNYEKQKTGNTIKFTYSPRGQKGQKGWAGIYWLYPSANWGDQPGKDLSRYQKLSFMAKGDLGGEIVEFLVGGVDTGKQFRDSIQPVISKNCTLTSGWKLYEMPLPSAIDKSNVIGGFGWLIDTNQGGRCSTFYLRDIRYE
jgi:hypothetical protein